MLAVFSSHVIPVACLSVLCDVFLFMAISTAISDKTTHGYDKGTYAGVFVFCCLAVPFGIGAEYHEMINLDREIPVLSWAIGSIFLAFAFVVEMIRDHDLRRGVCCMMPAFVRKLLKLQTTSLACC